MKLDRKKVDAMILLEAEARLTIPEIPVYSERIIPELLAEAAACDLLIVGPCIFSYQGCDGRPDTVFTLKVGFPVMECMGLRKFSCVDLPAYECVSTVYRGRMDGIGLAWGEFSEKARLSGLPLGEIAREVYVHWVEGDSYENITELQIPLKKEQPFQ